MKNTAAVTDELDLDGIMRRVNASPQVVVDVETSGLDWKTNHVVGWVLTFGPAPQDSVYLPVRHASGNLAGIGTPHLSKTGWDGKPLPFETDLLTRLNKPSKRLVFHNGGFDLKFMWRLGFTDINAKIEDTMINAPLINEWQGKFSLDYCTRVAGVQAKHVEIYDYIRGSMPDVQIPKDEEMGSYWRLPGNDPVAVEYAVGDGTSTWQLRDWQALEIEKQDLRRVWAIESRLIPVLVRMSCHGIKVDEERLERLIGDTEAEIEDLLRHFPSGFNPRGPSDVRKFCEAAGHTDWPVTAKKKQPSFPESWLATHEPGKKIVQIRQRLTLLNTFLRPMRDRHVFEGRVHPTYHQLRNDEFGTITGRLSCTDPNLQAASKRNEEVGRKHRSIFVADEDNTWVSADYRQCEPVLLAEYSQCKVLVDGFKSVPPLDPHQAVANACGIDRQTGKRVNQTLITGGGKGVLVSKYGIPESEVDRVWRDYFTAMPEIKTLQQKASSRMRVRGYVMSLLGRRARLRERGLDYQAMNRLLQCGNADIIKAKMVEIDDYLASEGRPMNMLNNVHDSIDFQHPDADPKHIKECLRIMTDFKEGEIKLSLPLEVDTDSGKDWAEATFGAED